MSVLWYRCAGLGHLGQGKPGDPNVVSFDEFTHLASIDTNAPYAADLVAMIEKYRTALDIRDVDPDDLAAAADPPPERCPATIPGTAETFPQDVTPSPVPCPFRADTTAEINRHVLAVHAPQK